MPASLPMPTRPPPDFRRRRASLGHRGLRRTPYGRPRNAEVLPKGAPLVFRPEQPPPLELRRHQLDKILERVRYGVRQQVESVRGLSLEPLLELVDDLFR